MKKILSFFVFVLLFLSLVNFADAGVKEWWGETKERAAKTWDASKKVGKAIKDGAKRAGEKTRELAKSAKKKWEDSEHPCVVCGEIIHINSKRCVRCGFDLAKSKSKSVVEYSKKSYMKTTSLISDPVRREKAVRIVVTTMEIRAFYKDAKKSTSREGIYTISEIQIFGMDETLGESASRKLKERFPEIANTGVFDDPAATTTAVILCDRKFFIEEIEIVRLKGENISIREAVEKTSPMDPARLVAYIEMVEAAENFSDAVDGDGNAGVAAIDFANAVKAANK